MSNNEIPIENKMDPAGGKKTDVVLIIVIILVVIVFALPAVLFALFYFRFIKPTIDEGISDISYSTSGYAIDDDTADSFKRVYMKSIVGDVIEYDDCKAIEAFTNVETERDYDFCSSGFMAASIGFDRNGIDMKFKATNGGVEYILDSSFSGYYQLKRYIDADAMEGDFLDYRLSCATSCPVDEPYSNPGGPQEDSEVEESIDDSLEEILESTNI